MQAFEVFFLLKFFIGIFSLFFCPTKNFICPRKTLFADEKRYLPTEKDFMPVAAAFTVMIYSQFFAVTITSGVPESAK